MLRKKPAIAMSIVRSAFATTVQSDRKAVIRNYWITGFGSADRLRVRTQRTNPAEGKKP